MTRFDESALIRQAKKTAIIHDQNVHRRYDRACHRRRIGSFGQHLSPLPRHTLPASDFSTRHGFLLAENKSGAGGGIMAKIIEFYIPKDFYKIAKWVPAEKRGQVIEFSLPKKTA
jgi:hypothetical protein